MLRRALLSIFLLALPFLALVLAMTKSFDGEISPTQGRDFRVQGLSQTGWSLPSFKLVEDRISAISALVTISFEPSERSSNFDFYLNDKIAYKNQAPVGVLELRSRSFKSLSLQAHALSPFLSEATNRQLGAKISSIRITPRKGLVFLPAFRWGAPLCLSLSLLMAAAWTLLPRKFRLLSALVPILACILWSFSHPDQWERSAYVFFAIAVFLFGLKLSRGLGPHEETELIIPYERVALILVLCFGAWLRFSALNFGLPEFYHPDESRKLKIADRIVKSGNLDPDYFFHPSFVVYSTALSSWVAEKVSGQTYHFKDRAIWGRAVTACLGTLTILIVYFLGRRWGTLAGFSAAYLTAVAPLHVICSRYIKEDISLTFFSLLSVLFVVRFLEKQQIYNLALCGLMAGFAASCKYSGILVASFVFLPSVCYILRLDRTLTWKSLLLPTILGLVMVPVGFVIITPYSILNSSSFIRDFLVEQRHMQSGHSGALPPSTFYWAFHLRYSILPALTPLVTFLGVFAMGFIGRSRTPLRLVVFWGCFLFYLPAEYVKAKTFPQPERYILPCIPFMALAIGEFYRIALTWLGRPSTLMFYGLMLISWVLPGTYSALHSYQARHDTRAEASLWIEQHIPTGANILMDWRFYGPKLDPARYKVMELLGTDKSQENKEFSIERFQEDKIDYVILSSFYYDRYIDFLKERHPLGRAILSLFNRVKPEVIWSKRAYQYGFHNPEIRVFKIPKKES